MSGQETFGRLLRKYRHAANLTQEELAERSGLSVEGIGVLERGDRRSPRPSTVEYLSGALRLTPEQKERFIAAARGVPDASLATGAAPARTNLPLYLTRFIGRERE